MYQGLLSFLPYESPSRDQTCSTLCAAPVYSCLFCTLYRLKRFEWNLYCLKWFLNLKFLKSHETGPLACNAWWDEGFCCPDFWMCTSTFLTCRPSPKACGHYILGVPLMFVLLVVSSQALTLSTTGVCWPLFGFLCASASKSAAEKNCAETAETATRRLESFILWVESKLSTDFINALIGLFTNNKIMSSFSFEALQR